MAEFFAELARRRTAQPREGVRKTRLVEKSRQARKLRIGERGEHQQSLTVARCFCAAEVDFAADQTQLAPDRQAAAAPKPTPPPLTPPTSKQKRQSDKHAEMKNILLFLAVLALAGAAFPLAASDQPPTKPNILFIMVDDMGKEWAGCYGAEDIKTPNIDALAAGGMKFHNAYSMPACSPSRTTLLTGKYPNKTGWANHWDVPRWGVGYFDWKKKENTTFARLMKDLGYATCAAGKWQINDFRVEPQAMKKHGFDDWAMWTGSETGNPPSDNRYQDPYINTPEAGSKTYAGRFGPDIYTDRLIDFMRKHKEEPMCLYYPIPLVHNPFVPTPDEPNAKSRDDRHKAMLRYADKMVGRLVAELDELGLRDRTVIIFTSDNGTDPKITGTRNGQKTKGAKGELTEGAVNAPFIVNWPGTVPAGVESPALTDLTDMLPTFVELGGGQVPADLDIDGSSIAPLILGN
ncbi:MAG: sulfatase-like hydrolase/transferase [Chthoniobacterales bacterium]